MTFSGKTIIMTSVFGNIVIFMYGLFGYYYVSETFFNRDTGDRGGENLCQSVWLCFMTVFALVKFYNKKKSYPQKK